VVDYAALARSYGVYGEGPIEDPEALRPALERAVKQVRDKKQPALVDVVTQPRLDRLSIEKWMVREALVRVRDGELFYSFDGRG